MNYPLPESSVEWILCPQIFEYPWIKSASTEQYIWYASKNPNSELPKPLADWLATISFGERVVYCSLGTLGSHTPEITLSFLRLVTRATSKLSGVKLIMAVGTHLESLSNSHSKSIFLTDRLPQTAILPYCNAMITHGGMNTVKECICAGVPMLIYPLNDHVEQPGNAARIVYHGLGLAGDIIHESEAGIQQKVLSVLRTPGFKDRVLSMQQHFQLEASLFYPMDLAKSP